jgi:glucose uptake protein GlcU
MQCNNGQHNVELRLQYIILLISSMYHTLYVVLRDFNEVNGVVDRTQGNLELR